MVLVPLPVFENRIFSRNSDSFFKICDALLSDSCFSSNFETFFDNFLHLACRNFFLGVKVDTFL